MKRKFLAAAVAAVLLFAGGCGSAPEKAEIKIPILEGDSSGNYRTAEVSRRDLEQYMNVAGTVEYAYADVLTIDHDTNLLEYNVKRGDKLSAGDVIAVFSSSDLDYDVQNQKLLTDSAYSRYLSSGSEAAKTEYEIEAERSELMQFRVDSYTIRAPYDCVVVSAERFDTGAAVTAGTPVCTVAKPDEIYITVDQNKDRFAFGMPVGIKFGTSEVYSARVVMQYDGTSGRNGINGKVLIGFDDGELARATEVFGNLVSSGWATVVVRTFDKHGALCVPKDAVMMYSGTTYCYLANDGNRTRIPIETGDTIDDLTIVLSGLAEGDTVSYN